MSKLPKSTKTKFYIKLKTTTPDLYLKYIHTYVHMCIYMCVFILYDIILICGGAYACHSLNMARGNFSETLLSYHLGAGELNSVGHQAWLCGNLS